MINIACFLYIIGSVKGSFTPSVNPFIKPVASSTSTLTPMVSESAPATPMVKITATVTVSPIATIKTAFKVAQAPSPKVVGIASSEIGATPSAVVSVKPVKPTPPTEKIIPIIPVMNNTDQNTSIPKKNKTKNNNIYYFSKYIAILIILAITINYCYKIIIIQNKTRQYLPRNNITPRPELNIKKDFNPYNRNNEQCYRRLSASNSPV